MHRETRLRPGFFLVFSSSHALRSTSHAVRSTTQPGQLLWVCACAGLGGYGWAGGTRCKYVLVSSRAPSMAHDGPASPPVPALDRVLVRNERAPHVRWLIALCLAMATEELSGAGTGRLVGPLGAMDGAREPPGMDLRRVPPTYPYPRQSVQVSTRRLCSPFLHLAERLFSAQSTACRAISSYCKSRRFKLRRVGFFQAVTPATLSTAKPPRTTAGTSPSSLAIVPA